MAPTLPAWAVAGLSLAASACLCPRLQHWRCGTCTLCASHSGRCTAPRSTCREGSHLLYHVEAHGPGWGSFAVTPAVFPAVTSAAVSGLSQAAWHQVVVLLVLVVVLLVVVLLVMTALLSQGTFLGDLRCGAPRLAGGWRCSGLRGGERRGRELRSFAAIKEHRKDANASLLANRWRPHNRSARMRPSVLQLSGRGWGGTRARAMDAMWRDCKRRGWTDQLLSQKRVSNSTLSWGTAQAKGWCA